MPQCDPRARGSPKARKLLNRPALRGGVIWPGVSLTPGLYPAQKSNVWITLQSLSALPFRAGGKRPQQRGQNRRPPQPGHRGATPHFIAPVGWDAAHSPEGPQTPSNGPTQGKRREGRPAGAERPRHGSHGLLKRGGFRLLLELEFFVGETLRRGNSKMLQPPGENL